MHTLRSDHIPRPETPPASNIISLAKMYLVLAIAAMAMLHIFGERITGIDRLYPVLSGSFYPGQSGDQSGFVVEAPAFDGILYLYDHGHFIESAPGLPIEPPFHYSISFARGISPVNRAIRVLRPDIAFRLYFAQSGAGRYYFAFNENISSECGFFKETPGRTERIGSGRVYAQFDRNSSLDVELSCDGAKVSVSINGDSRETADVGDLENFYFRLEPRDYSNNLLVDRIVTGTESEDGGSFVSARGRFHNTPFFCDIPAEMRSAVSDKTIAIACLFLMLICALLFDSAAVFIPVSVISRTSGHISLEDILFLLIPLQAFLLYVLRNTFAFPVSSLTFAIAVIGTSKFILVLVFSPAGSGSSKTNRFRLSLLPPAAVLFYLFFFSSTAIPSDLLPSFIQPETGSWVIVTAPLLVAACGSLLAPGFQPAAFLITTMQLFSFYLFSRLAPGIDKHLFGALMLIPWLLATIIHTLRKRRKHFFISLPLLLSITLLLAWFTELGVRGNGFLNNRLDFEMKVREFLWDLENHTDLFNRVREKDLIEFEGVAHPREKPAGRFRIICLGSSSTEGQGPVDKTVESYPRFLEDLLEKDTNRDVEVVNGGIGGASLYALKIYLEEVLIRLDPDLVVLYFGRNGDKPGMRTYYERLKKEAEEAPFINTREQMWAATRLKWNPPWLLNLFLEAARLRLFMGGIVVADFLRHEEPYSEVTSGERLSLEKSAAEIVEICMAGGAEILLVPEIDLAAISNKGSRHSCYSVFADLAEKHRGEGVFFDNIIEAFTPGKASRIIVDTVHMNSEGYLFLAAEIEKILFERAFLPRANGSKAEAAEPAPDATTPVSR